MLVSVVVGVGYRVRTRNSRATRFLYFRSPGGSTKLLYNAVF